LLDMSSGIKFNESYGNPFGQAASFYYGLGRLYLNNGNWNGQQIVPEAWVKASVVPDDENPGKGFYENQWWLYEDNVYAAEGILGQFVYVNPNKNLIIVRLGKKYGKTSPWDKVFGLIASQY